MNAIDVEMVNEILSKCMREELRDHAFGDAEVSWMYAGKQAAYGYFSSSSSHITLTCPDGEESATLRGEEARRFRYCGIEGTIERNDETGPEEYSEGTCMPALTHKGVLEELTKRG
jgi:hypothetical protein